MGAASCTYVSASCRIIFKDAGIQVMYGIFTVTIQKQSNI